jgi:hypothetical protein
MYRLAQRLFDKGWRVFFKHERQFDAIWSWPLGKDSTNTVLFIDRAEGTRDLRSLHSWVANNPQLRIVMAAREIDWTQRGFALHAEYHKHFPLGRLQPDEIGSLAALLVTFQAVDPPQTIPELRQLLHQSVHESEYPHMLAAVMTASRGTDFKHVLASLVEHFPYSSLLKWTALCASGSSSASVRTYATRRLFSALHCGDASEPIETGAGKFEAAHRQVRSEIVLIHGDRYDLRHPDITRFVLQHYYEADAAGVLRKTSELEDDLYAILRAVVRIRLHENYERFKRGLPDSYIYEIPRSWWSSPMAPDHEVGRQLYQDVHDRLGFLKADRRLCANILFDWMSLEASLSPDNHKGIQVQEKWLPALVDILSQALTPLLGSKSDEEEETSDLLFKAYDRWISFAMRQGRIGKLEAPEVGTIRQIFRAQWETHGGRLRGSTMLFWLMKNDHGLEGLGSANAPKPYTIRGLCRALLQDRERINPQILSQWAQLETKHGNYGEIKEPAEGTARWIFRAAWSEAERLCNSQLIVHWAKMEADAKNLGDDIAPEPHTARWIFRAAWKDANLRSANLVIHWAKMEAEVKNLGDQDVPDLYTARWLLREAWQDANLRSKQLVMELAQVEVEAKNLGNSDDPDPYTARWLFREAWQDQGLRSTQLVTSWARIEFEARNVGDKDAPAPYTAHWLFREAWKEANLRSAELMRNWASMEAIAQNLGDKVVPEPYTARWVFREAWKRPKLRSAELMRNWASMEAIAQNLGDKVAPEPYTARWVFSEALKEKGLRSGELMRNWAGVEANAKNLGDQDAPEPYTARWLFHETWNKADQRSVALVIQWVAVEAEAKNLGDKDAPEPYTARWLFREAWKERNLSAGHLSGPWAAMEAEAKNLGDKDAPESYTARWLFREAWNVADHRSAELVIQWAAVEAEAKNLGDKDAPEPFTARWLFREAWNEPTKLCNGRLLGRWAWLEIGNRNFGNYRAEYTAKWIANCSQMDMPSRQHLTAAIAAETGNLGDFHDPAQGSARHTWRTLFSGGHRFHLRTWAKYERAARGIANLSEEYSASWIYDQWKQGWPDRVTFATFDEWLQETIFGGERGHFEDASLPEGDFGSDPTAAVLSHV